MKKRDPEPKRERFDFEAMKAAALNKNAEIRRQAFIDYFERFQEFPSYLFDNETKIHDDLLGTMRTLQSDATTSKDMQNGINALLGRLPS